MKPIITVKEARKIMGKDANKFTDEELEKLIDDLHTIARFTIKDIKEGKFKLSAQNKDVPITESSSN